jgi:hypothetical protein
LDWSIDGGQQLIPTSSGYRQPPTLPTSPSAKERTMRADIVPGGIFPDYELTDHTKSWRRNWEAGDHSKQLRRHPSDPATAVS